MQGTAETFVCVECEQVLPADKLAFDTDPDHYLGVCTACDEALQAAEALPAWMSREVA
jgi:NAD-dependent SIR2 family protein deacetylase